MENKIYFDEQHSHVYLTAYVSEEVTTAPALVICPGGGYGYVSDREAQPVAERFQRDGFQCFVLYYSVADKAKFPQPMMDLAAAVEYLKAHSEQYHIDVTQMYFLGFSAGANLCANYASHWKLYHQNIQDDWQPKGVLCGYPSVNFYNEDMEKIDTAKADDVFYFENAAMIQELAKGGERVLCEGINYSVFGQQIPDKKQLEEYDLLTNVDYANMPPMYLFATAKDEIVSIEDLLQFSKNLYVHGVEMELHLFRWGSHGLSLGDETTAKSPSQIDAHYHHWVEMATEWMKRNSNH